MIAPRLPLHCRKPRPWPAGIERHGIGRLLMETPIAACKRQGLHRMVAVIGDAPP